jgi:hypothetical protein
MTQTAAITKSLLDGDILSIMTAFKMFSCTNLPREISRSIEQKFGVEVSKERVDFTSKYGQSGYYFRYRLNKTEYNKKGIELMREYVKENFLVPTPKDKPIYSEQTLFQ